MIYIMIYISSNKKISYIIWYRSWYISIHIVKSYIKPASSGAPGSRAFQRRGANARLQPQTSHCRWKKREKIHFIWKNIYRAIFVFQEQRWRCLQMWKSEETNIPRKLKMLLGVVQSTLYQVQGTLYQVLGTGWTGVAKHSKAQVPKILLGAIPHSTSWLDISHLQSVL